MASLAGLAARNGGHRAASALLGSLISPQCLGAGRAGALQRSLQDSPHQPWSLRTFATVISFPLAQTGEGILECEMVKWFVKEGDTVGQFDKVCEVQSDKASIEITSRFSGKVVKLHHSPGAMVKVGVPLVDFEVTDEEAAAAVERGDVPKPGTAPANAPAHHNPNANPTTTTAGNPSMAQGASGAARCSSADAADAAAVGLSRTAMSSAMVADLPGTTAVPPPTSAMPIMPSASSPTSMHAGATSMPAATAGVSGSALPRSGEGVVMGGGTAARAGDGALPVLASPAVRMTARELGIDLRLVAGSGPGGRITKEDLTAFQQQQLQQQQHAAAVEMAASPLAGGGLGGLHDGSGAAAVAAAGASGGGASAGRAAAARVGGDGGGGSGRPITDVFAEYQRRFGGSPGGPASVGASAATADSIAVTSTVVPIRGYRRAMVKSMTAAAAIPHFHFCDEICLDQLAVVREELKQDALAKGLRLTYMPFIIKALSLALSAHPGANASLDGSGTNVLIHPGHNVGVAMATPQGLVVPNVKQVQSKSVLEIAEELSLLQQLAAAGKLPPEALQGGTITVSNIGTIGGTYAAPLVNPPESVIVALGKAAILPRYAYEPPTVAHGSLTRSSSHGSSFPAGCMYDHQTMVSGSSSMMAPKLPLVVPKAILPVSWGADHRVLDGAGLAGLSASWKAFVERPAKMLLGLR